MVSFQGIHLLQIELPPLLSPNPGTMIWTIVTFVLLLIVLGKFAWKPLLAALEAREKGIQDSLETAERLKKESEELLRQHDEKLRAAAEEVKSILEEGRRDADSLRTGILEKAQSDAKDTLERATREIDLAKDKALDEIRQESVDLSVALASKVIEKSLRPEDHEELIRGSMKELKL